MRKIKLAVLITALLSPLSHGAPALTPTNLCMLINERGGDIKAFKSTYRSPTECAIAREAAQQGGHTKAVLFCGTNLQKSGIYTKPKNSAIITK